jgi:hypothetical protein
MKIIAVSPKPKPIDPKEIAKDKLKTVTTQGQKLDIILEHLGLKEG